MKRKFTLLIAALALLTMIVQPGKAWGQAPVNTVLWGETWARFSANDVPSGEQSGDGLTIYGSATVEYSVTNGGGTTKIYNEKLAGGTAPELLLAKSNATWTITGIPTGQATEMSLVFLSNKTTLSLTSTTEGITISGSGTNWTITATSSVLSFNLTLTNTGSANARIDDFVLTVTTAGGGGGSDPEIHFNGQSANIGTNHPVGTPVSTQFTVYQSNLTEDITFQIEGYGSLDHSSVAQGADATEVTWSYTPTAAGEFNTTITATSGTVSATYTIYGEAKAVHNVNIAEMTNGSVTASPISGIQGTNIDLTITPDTGYALETLSVVDGNNNELTVSNNRFQMPDSDVTVSATFEVSSAVTVVDNLDRAFTGIISGSTNYGNWNNKVGVSGAVYAGNSAGGNDAIQLRSNNNNSGIVTTTSGGKVTKVVVAWNTNTTGGRKLDIYGKNSAYSTASDLYGANSGTKLGTIEYDNNAPLNISGDYEYIGIRSQSGALYLDEIEITWSTSSSSVAAPTFSVEAGNYWETQSVEISCETEGASIFYTTNGDDPDNNSTPYTQAISITETTTLKAIAYKDNEASNVATATYTILTPLTTMEAIFNAAGTSTATVAITFGNWVVSGVNYYSPSTMAFLTDGEGKGCVIYNTSGHGLVEGNIVSGTVICTLQKINGYARISDITSDDVTVNTGGTVNVYDIDLADLTGVNTGALVHYDNLTCSVNNNNYYLTDGTTSLQVYKAIWNLTYSDYLEAGKSYNITGVYQQYNAGQNETKEILPRSADDIEEATSFVPTITVTPSTVNVDAEEHDGTLNLTYDNLTITGIGDFDIQYYDAQGEETDEPDWAEFVLAEQEGYVVSYYIMDNEGDARTAYFKVFAMGDTDFVYSNLVTVTQAEYVVDYATLPFAFIGGRADIANTTGLTQNGLDSDYASAPKLKFNDTGDWVILKINERPGTLTFDLKGYSFSDGTFTVQTSEDGETYTDLQAYTDLGDTQSESFDNLGENVRYIKWIYTEKVNGNVALGNIELKKYVEPVLIPSITVDPAAVSADAEEHDGTLDLTYENLTITSMNDFDIQYYDAQGAETTEPDWVEVLIAEQDPTIGEGYVVSYYMIENEGDARTAYFKVYALDGEEFVYSNLVTINQAAPETPVVTDNYELYSGALVEGDYLIVYEDYAMNNVVDSDRLQYAEVEITEGVISTDNAAIVWHIAQSGEYWTIYSADANSYAAGTGVKNKAQMLEDGTDDMAMWTVSVSGTETYNFVNKANTEAGVNAYLRNNGTYGFACYASGTGGPLSLYKKQDNTPALTAKDVNIASDVIEGVITYTLKNPVQGGTLSAEITDGNEGYWLTLGTLGETLPFTCSANDGNERAATVTFTYTYENSKETLTATAVVTQAAPAPAAQTYTLVTSVDDIVPGKHYIIAGIYNNEYYAMAGQATNNRSQVKVTASNEGNTITEVDGLYEFVFSGDNTNNWTIYDETNKGYLYAAGTGASNQLKYQAVNNDRGIWTISINDNNEANVTSITTQTERKIMRYNSSNSCFSCYGSGQNPIYIYMKDNDTSDPVYYSPSVVTVTEDVDASVTPVVVLENEILTLTGSLTSSSPDDIVINDGGQLVFNGDGVQATVKKQTIGGTKADMHWYTIASPVANNKFGDVANLTSATYDLYRYNETTSTWENYKETAPEPHAGFYYGDANSAFEAGRGYLYYNEAGSELSFAGTLNNDNVTYNLTAGSSEFTGINLIGNPFTQDITLANIEGEISEGGYVLNNANDWSADPNLTIKPCEGFLVQVATPQEITINKTPSSKSRANHDYIALTVTNNEYEDVAYALFSNGMGLNKINHRNADIPMVYIPQDGKNYAIATMSDNTEMFNLNFKAMTTGKYTLSYKAQGTYSYLHVIDRFTGEDIDMLVEGEYSFIGSSYDNDARFIVKLSYNANIDEFDTNSIFAYQNGDEIIVNGEGQLQVYDVMGRFVQCINVNGTESISASQFSDAVYIFRMIGETVKTQKIVVR